MKNKILTELVSKIHSESGELQEEALKIFIETHRKLDFNLLKKYGTFLVFNPQYFADVYGSNIIYDEYLGLYKKDYCIFNSRLVIPLRGLDNLVHGFVGYDDGSSCVTEEEKVNNIKYLYPSKDCFNKSSHFFLERDEYEDAFNKQYIFIVDGIFDKIALQSCGYPAVSLLGTALTSFHKKALSYIKNWIVFADNDRAGEELYKKCKLVNPYTSKVQTNNTKDFDELWRVDKEVKTKLDLVIKDVQQNNFLLNSKI